MADEEVEQELRYAANKHGHNIHVAIGALWGGHDLKRLAEMGTLDKVEITMHFHPKAIRLPEGSELTPKQPNVAETLYKGPVRRLCSLAPNNVNTMATAAIVGLGFDRTIGILCTSPQ